MRSEFPKSVKISAWNRCAGICECGCGQKMPDLTCSDVEMELSYYQDTGVFLRLVDGRKWRTGDRADKKNVAGGYHRISLRGGRYLAHRLAWLLIIGDWPHGLVDHVDGNPSNNSWANLRLASKSQNGANMHKGGRGVSGSKGVVPQRNGRWQARIMKNRRYIFLGTFDTVDEASDAYELAATRLFGEFAKR